MLEEDEGVAPLPAELLHLPGPLLEILLRVPLVAQPEVTEVRRGHERRRGLVRVRDTQRGVPFAQELVDVVRKPGLVAELPGTADVGRELRQEIAQARDVLLEVWGQLKQDRPELGPELPGGIQEEPQRVVDVLEPGDVRDALRRLEDEGEARRRGGIPAGDGRSEEHT